MALPVDARPLEGTQGWTNLVMDDGQELPVYDPDGSFLREGQSVAQMRSSGALGPDQRMASNAHMPPQQPGADPFAGATPATPDAVRNFTAPPPPRPAAAGGPVVVTVPGTPGGMRTSGRQTTGLAPDDKARIEKLHQDLNAGAIDFASYLEQLGGIKAEREQATLTQQGQRAAIERDTERGQTAQLEQRAQRAKQTLDGALKRDYDPARLWGNPWFAISAAIGGLAGELLVMKGKRDPKQQLQFWQSINGMVQDDIQRQIDANSGFVAAAKAELNDATGALAESVARGRYFEDVANALDVAAQTAPAEIREEYALMAQRARLESKKNQADAALAIADKQATSETFVPGTPERTVVLPSVSAQEREAAIAADLPEGLKPNQKHEAYEKLRKEYGSNSLLLNRINTAREAVRRFSENGDVAGLGPLAQYIPTGINSQDAVAVRQSLGIVLSAYLKEVSGAAVTEQEFERLQEQVKGDGSLASVERGLSLVETPARQALETMSGAYPTIFSTFESANRRGAVANRGLPQPKGRR